jgi:ribonucleoside-diphosphate reductase beta chain
VFLPGYGHFLRVAEGLQWIERDVDLSVDRVAWPSLPRPLRDRVTALVAGFCVGEQRVASELDPFADAATSEDAAACFRAQRRDEERHARFFDRVADEVLGVAGADAGERQEALRRELSPGFAELFDIRLAAATSRLAAGEERLDRAVALYHMLLEGVVFTAGQLALLELLARGQMPGVRAGVELVLRDERWHIGFGARVLDDLGTADEMVTRLLEEARSMVGCWNGAVPAHLRQRVLALHRRRIAAARLTDARRPRETAAVTT